MLTATEVASMQVAQAQTMTSSCVVTHRALASDGMGGQTETLTTANMLCRIAPTLNMPDYQLVGARVGETALWRATFAAGTDVRKTDKIAVGEKSYEVLGVLGGKTVETARICICIERP